MLTMPTGPTRFAPPSGLQLASASRNSETMSSDRTSGRSLPAGGAKHVMAQISRESG